MRYLVTGGAGFIGAHFVQHWLSQHPADEVVVLDRLTYAGSRQRLAEAERSGRCRFLEGDVCDARAVREALRQVEFVVHFAAETHVDRSIADAGPFLRANVEGTYTLLQETRARGITRLLHISTDEVYGPVLQGAVDEQAPLAPRSPYAASKAAADLLVQAFRETYGLPATIARPTNIFGPAQLPEKFIPLCIVHGLEGLPVPVYGDGRQRRAWLYVTDLCEALQTIIERGTPGETYNVAGGAEQENLETAQQVLAGVGRSASLIECVADRPGHDRRYAMDDAKLRALGWRPRTDFAQGLGETIAWFRAQSDWWRPLVVRLRDDPHHWFNRAPRTSAQQAIRSVR